MTPWMRLKSGLSDLYETIPRMDSTDLCSVLTLFLLIFQGGDFWYMHIPLRVLCLSALVLPSLRRTALFWLLILVVVAAGNARNWIVIDNHKYLITYWCLVLFLVFLRSS